MTENIMTKAQAVYEKAYTDEWYRKTGTSPIRIVGGVPGGEQTTYETEGNFFMCGFTWLTVKAVGSGKSLIAMAREAGLHVSKGYPSGFSISFKDLATKVNPYEGNGDHYIQVYAYGEAISFLTKNGYTVGMYQNLD